MHLSNILPLFRTKHLIIMEYIDTFAGENPFTLDFWCVTGNFGVHVLRFIVFVSIYNWKQEKKKIA